MGALIPFAIAGGGVGAGTAAIAGEDPDKWRALYGAGGSLIGRAGGAIKTKAKAAPAKVGAASATSLTGPSPSPVPLDIETLEKDRAKRRQKLRTFGRQGTILTQGGLGEPQVRRATLLGGAA